MEPCMTVQALEDGCCRVRLQQGPYSVSCTVSSMHLVEDKRSQLLRALQAMQQEQQG
jgi:hypothetical protein